VPSPTSQLPPRPDELESLLRQRGELARAAGEIDLQLRRLRRVPRSHQWAWCPADEQFIRDSVGKLSQAQMAVGTARTHKAVKAYCKRRRLIVHRRHWTEQERELLRAQFRKVPAEVIGKQMGRTARMVYQCAWAMGLSMPQRFRAPDMVAYIREKNAVGWSDSEIAESRRVDRHAVTIVRKELGLPSNAQGDRTRRKLRDALYRQLARVGVRTPGEWRVKIFRDRARAAGWPEDLRPRAVQILNALWDRGPMTRREIAEAIGMPWKGSRKSMTSNDTEGSYLAHLIARGLVIVFIRAGKVTGKGKGRSVNIYSLPLDVQRRKVVA
jgi:hypothetical protein